QLPAAGSVAGAAGRTRIGPTAQHGAEAATAVMRRKHVMPFGTECRDDGTVRFRLWAPKAKSVSLCLESSEVITMPRLGDGWFELVREVPAGARYDFQIDNNQRVPDPASRYQPDGVHGSSQVIEPAKFDWQDGGWRGRPWREAVVYELHIGTFTPEG